MYRARILAAAAAATLVAGAGAASAQGMGGFYLKGFGGWTIPQDNNFKVTDIPGGVTGNSGLSFDSGYLVGGAVGYAVRPNVAVELEYAYRNANADYKNTPARGESESNAVMANAIYTFDGMGPNGAFKPYIGAGLGAADLNVRGKNGVEDFDGGFNFAYQAITGVAYDLNPNWTLNGEVRYFGIADQTLDNSNAKYKTGYSTFDALVGVTYHF